MHTLIKVFVKGTMSILLEDIWPLGMEVQFTIDVNKGDPMFCVQPFDVT